MQEALRSVSEVIHVAPEVAEKYGFARGDKNSSLIRLTEDGETPCPATCNALAACLEVMDGAAGRRRAQCRDIGQPAVGEFSRQFVRQAGRFHQDAGQLAVVRQPQVVGPFQPHTGAAVRVQPLGHG